MVVRAFAFHGAHTGSAYAGAFDVPGIFSGVGMGRYEVGVQGDFTALRSGRLNAICPVSTATGLSHLLTCACPVLGRVPTAVGPKLAKDCVDRLAVPGNV